jgi:hypothetical protein
MTPTDTSMTPAAPVTPLRSKAAVARAIFNRLLPDMQALGCGELSRAELLGWRTKWENIMKEEMARLGPE